MRFYVKRTSGEYDKKPCEQAKVETHTDGDGFNWYVQVNTLEELCALQDEIGSELIFGIGEVRKGPDKYEKVYMLEIYDDYRE